MKKKEKLDILYEDKYIIAINKPANLLTISTDKEKERTLYRKVSLYVKKQHKSNKIFIIHRLDKDTSGIIIFAKNLEIKNIMQRNWDKSKRKYIALVEGKVTETKTIKNWLRETKTLYTYSSNKPNDGKLAITRYKPINIAAITARYKASSPDVTDIFLTNNPIVPKMVIDIISIVRGFSTFFITNTFNQYC